MNSVDTNPLATTGNFAFAAGADTIRVGLVGCGGRGRDAIQNVCQAAEGVEILAIGDAFKDRTEKALETFGNLGSKNRVTAERTFVGLDAYKHVLESGINYVILTTPPGYRPLHLKAAVEKGVNVFMEKPVATCPTGIRTVAEASGLAALKGLSIVAGTQRRHQAQYLETIKRIHDGAIGEIIGGGVYWNQGGMWAVAREPAMTDVEWMLRNWQYFTAIGGDHVVEQHIHNIDIANWFMNSHPVRAIGMGGRGTRVDPLYGHVYDHFSVEFEYPNGAKIMSTCRQQDGTQSRVGEFAIGMKGKADPSGSIQPETKWRYDAPKPWPNPYVVEHTDNIAAIRAGKPLNEGIRVAESTLTAIMGREAAYSGQEITWDQIVNASLDLRPDRLTLSDNHPVPPVAIPGKYKLV